MKTLEQLMELARTWVTCNRSMYASQSDANNAREQAQAALQAALVEVIAENEALDASETQLIQERDHREEIIDRLCDAVLGTNRYEWSSAYSFEDAIEEVEVKTAVLDMEVSELYALRAENKRLRDALGGVLPWVVTQEFACHGMKCREPLCQSCSNDTEIACQKACDAYHSANTALKETK